MNRPWYQYAGRKPDTFELTVRFVCGALAGLLLGLWIAVHCWPLAPLQLAGTLIACAIVLGYLAAKFGDAFWREALQWFR